MPVVGGIAGIYFCGSVLRQQGSERLIEESGIWRSFASAPGALEEMFIDRGTDANPWLAITMPQRCYTSIWRSSGRSAERGDYTLSGPSRDDAERGGGLDIVP